MQYQVGMLQHLFGDQRDLFFPHCSLINEIFCLSGRQNKTAVKWSYMISQSCRLSAQRSHALPFIRLNNRLVSRFFSFGRRSSVESRKSHLSVPLFLRMAQRKFNFKSSSYSGGYTEHHQKISLAGAKFRSIPSIVL